MSEVEKQGSQKTVVAFITGLLVGGLLVWVFSSTPPKTEEPKDEKTTTEEVVKKEEPTKVTTETKAVPQKVGAGDASIMVAEQKAGKRVALGALKLPTRSGWVVVRDYMDGTPGNVLGAARFNTDEGLMPTSVDLIRETMKGSSYQIVYFTNEGGVEFKTGEDMLIDGVSSTFKAN